MPTVTLIPGDGVGPELWATARLVLDEVTAAITWELVEAGELAFARTGCALPNEVMDSVFRNQVALKGPLTNPGRNYPSPTAELRKAMDLWCNVRVGEALSGVRTRYPGASITVIRETTEDLGSSTSHFLGPDVGVALKVTTRATVARLAQFALGYAEARGHKNVVVPHHGAILRTTDGLFVSVVMEEARERPGLNVVPELIDTVLMHLVQDPSGCDVILTNNFYGGFFAGLVAGLTGGVGLMASANLGGGRAALFEPAHGTAPKYVGQNKVNPMAMILAGALLLEHLGLIEESDAVRRAVRDVMAEGRYLTYDQGGTSTTVEMAQAVARHLHRPTQ